MKSRMYLPLVVVSLLLLQLSPASAQYDYGSGISKSSWNIHIEGAIVGNTGGGAADDLESRIADGFLSAGIGYETPLRTSDSKSWLGVSFDYVPVSDVLVGPDAVDAVAMVPALMYYRKGWAIGNSRIWAAAGAGFRWAEEDIPEMDIDKGTALISSFQIGIDFTHNVFTEVRYFQGPHPSDDAFITGGIGFRF